MGGIKMKECLYASNVEKNKHSISVFDK